MQVLINIVCRMVIVSELAVLLELKVDPRFSSLLLCDKLLKNLTTAVHDQCRENHDCLDGPISDAEVGHSVIEL